MAEKIGDIHNITHAICGLVAGVTLILVELALRGETVFSPIIFVSGIKEKLLAMEDGIYTLFTILFLQYSLSSSRWYWGDAMC